MALLTLLQHDPVAVARLESALRTEHRLVRCPSWSSLWEVVLTSPVEGCIVDIYDPVNPVSLWDLQRLRHRQPPIAIVVCSDFGGRELDLFELGRLKIDSVILAGCSDGAHDTRRAVTQALATAVAQHVANALEGRVHPLATQGLRWAVEHAAEDPGVHELADALRMSPRTLARELRRHDLLPARRLLLWARLFHAARLMDNPDRTVEQVSYDLGYSSAAALGRAFRREVGHSPTEVTRRGGVACVLEAFLRLQRRGRHGSRTRQRRSWMGPAYPA